MEVSSHLDEATLLNQLCHSNIIKLHTSFSDDQQLYMVMEFAEGGTLDMMIKDRKGSRMGQDLVLYYLTQITLALNYIHSKKILHRDLKTQNIFLNRKRTIVKVDEDHL